MKNKKLRECINTNKHEHAEYNNLSIKNLPIWDCFEKSMKEKQLFILLICTPHQLCIW
jgi:hypothetical protein